MKKVEQESITIAKVIHVAKITKAVRMMSLIMLLIWPQVESLNQRQQQWRQSGVLIFLRSPGAGPAAGPANHLVRGHWRSHRPSFESQTQILFEQVGPVELKLALVRELQLGLLVFGRARVLSRPTVGLHCFCLVLFGAASPLPASGLCARRQSFWPAGEPSAHASRMIRGICAGNRHENGLTHRWA